MGKMSNISARWKLEMGVALATMDGEKSNISKRWRVEMGVALAAGMCIRYNRGREQNFNFEE